MSNTDPPHEVDDRKAPSDRDGDTPDTDALNEQISEGKEQHHRHHEGDAEADEPSIGRRTREHDGADFFGDRTEGMAGLDDRGAFNFGRRFVLLWHAAAQLLASSSSLPTLGLDFSLLPGRSCV